MAGRPSKFTEENIRKIEEVAALDGSVEEMAYYAGIHVATLYRYFEENPTFSERIKALRERPVLKARQAVVKGLDDADRAFRYLQHKRRKEFSTRIEQDITSGGEALSTGTDVQELSKRFDDFLKRNDTGPTGGP